MSNTSSTVELAVRLLAMYLAVTTTESPLANVNPAGKQDLAISVEALKS